MKVMHLMSTHAFSGAENVACQIINSFKDNKDYEMIYVSEIKENKQNLDDRNIKYYELEKFNYKNVKKAIENLKPDIIHAHDIRASIMASLFHKKAKIVSHIHGNHENMRKCTIKSTLYRFASNNIAKIIWVSDSALNQYKYCKNVIDKSDVIYNVIDPNEIITKINSDTNEYSYDVIYLGRFSYPKNPIRFLDVIRNIVEKDFDIKVAMIGNGELENEVRGYIDKCNLGKNIKLYGFIKNPYKILNSSKILVMTSRYEGTPMCALEAIACGKPIVATPTDGLKEIVNDKTGFLSDDNEELSSKIIEIISDEILYKKIQSAVQENNKIVNNIQKYTNEIVKIYSSI